MPARMKAAARVMSLPQAARDAHMELRHTHHAGLMKPGGSSLATSVIVRPPSEWGLSLNDSSALDTASGGHSPACAIVAFESGRLRYNPGHSRGRREEGRRSYSLSSASGDHEPAHL
jgi:hypothetical protein